MVPWRLLSKVNSHRPKVTSRWIKKKKPKVAKLRRELKERKGDGQVNRRQEWEIGVQADDRSGEHGHGKADPHDPVAEEGLD